MSPPDDEMFEEMQRLALITRMMDDPGTVSDFDDLLGEDETASLIRYPDAAAVRKPVRKAGRRS